MDDEAKKLAMLLEKDETGTPLGARLLQGPLRVYFTNPDQPSLEVLELFKSNTGSPGDKAGSDPTGGPSLIEITEQQKRLTLKGIGYWVKGDIKETNNAGEANLVVTGFRDPDNPRPGFAPLPSSTSGKAYMFMHYGSYAHQTEPDIVNTAAHEFAHGGLGMGHLEDEGLTSCIGSIMGEKASRGSPGCPVVPAEDICKNPGDVALGNLIAPGYKNSCPPRKR